MASYDIQGAIHGPTLSRNDDAPRKRPRIIPNVSIMSSSSSSTSLTNFSTIVRPKLSSSTVPALSMRKGIRVKVSGNEASSGSNHVPSHTYRNLDSFFPSSSSSSFSMGTTTSCTTPAVDSMVTSSSSSSSSSPSMGTTGIISSSSTIASTTTFRTTEDETNYYESRNRKLREQVDTAISTLFRGLVFYINGSTGTTSNDDGSSIITHHNLVRLVSRYGGSCYLEPKVGKLTHILATSLTLSKINKYLQRCGSRNIPILHPQYIIDCIKHGSLLPERSYRILNDQTSTSLHQFFNEPVCRNPLTEKVSNSKEYPPVRSSSKEYPPVRSSSIEKGNTTTSCSTSSSSSSSNSVTMTKDNNTKNYVDRNNGILPLDDNDLSRGCKKKKSIFIIDLRGNSDSSLSSSSSLSTVIEIEEEKKEEKIKEKEISAMQGIEKIGL